MGNSKALLVSYAARKVHRPITFTGTRVTVFRVGTRMLHEPSSPLGLLVVPLAGKAEAKVGILAPDVGSVIVITAMVASPSCIDVKVPGQVAIARLFGRLAGIGVGRGNVYGPVLVQVAVTCDAMAVGKLATAVVPLVATRMAS